VLLVLLYSVPAALASPCLITFLLKQASMR
jgi:hypothetical protein